MARRVDCAYLAELVVEHRLDEDEAREVARDLAYNLREESLQALTAMQRLSNATLGRLPRRHRAAAL